MTEADQSAAPAAPVAESQPAAEPAAAPAQEAAPAAPAVPASVDVDVAVQLPPASADLSDKIAAIVLAAIENHKSGGGLLGEGAADVKAVVSAFGGLLADIGKMGAELSAEPLGVGEAFAIAGFKVVRKLSAK